MVMRRCLWARLPITGDPVFTTPHAASPSLAAEQRARGFDPADAFDAQEHGRARGGTSRRSARAAPITRR